MVLLNSPHATETFFHRHKYQLMERLQPFLQTFLIVVPVYGEKCVICKMVLVLGFSYLFWRVEILAIVNQFGVRALECDSHVEAVRKVIKIAIISFLKMLKKSKSFSGE